MRVTRGARRVGASTSQLFPENLPSADSAATQKEPFACPTGFTRSGSFQRRHTAL